MIGLLEVLTIVLLGVLVVCTVNNIIDDKHQIDIMKSGKVEFCRRHQWEYTHLGEMICGVCTYKVKENN